MRLVFRPIVEKDFAQGFDCIRDVFLYDESLKQLLFSMWCDLLSRQSAVGACIEDLDRTFGRAIVWFGIYVFAKPSFEHEVSSGLHPFIAPRILDLWQRSNVPLMDVSEIAAANAFGGVCVLKLHSGMPLDVYHHPLSAPIFDQNETFFHFAISGFRIRSILLEAYGKEERLLIEGMHYLVRSDTSRGLAEHKLMPPADRHPYVCGLDATDATSIRGTVLASLFTYKPPILELSRVEQEQLLYALGGNTDYELSELLNVSYPTIRKRWDSIYGKVGLCVPHIFTTNANPDAEVGRGSEKRRRVLRYIQFHREELRPYKW